jgi:hypothetical protein
MFMEHNTPQTSEELSCLSMAQAEDAAAALSVAASADQLLQWLNLSAVFLARAKEIRKRVEDVASEWIGVNGPLRCGPVSYVSRIEESTKCANVPLAVRAVLDACGGDLDSFCQYLRSDPLKYGSCARLLPQSAYSTVFRTESRTKLVLRQSDARFLPAEATEAANP